MILILELELEFCKMINHSNHRLLAVLFFFLEILYVGPKVSPDENASSKYLVRIVLNLISAGLLYAAAIYSGSVYYIPAALMTIALLLYLIGYFKKQPFQRSFLTFYLMLGSFAATLP